jgi:CHAT domain-containing protein
MTLTMGPLFDPVEVTVEEVQLPVPAAPVRAAAAGPPAPDPAYLMVRQLDSRRGFQTSILTADGKAAIISADVEVDMETLDEHLKAIGTKAPKAFAKCGGELAALVLPRPIHQVLAAMEPRQLVIIHDLEASRIPWEALRIADRDLARSGVSRRLEAHGLPVARWLQQRHLAEELNVLLIVNPTEDLDGAESEGERMTEILKSHPRTHVTTLHRDKATCAAVRHAFRSGDYDIVHYAGHAFFDPEARSTSGLICADGVLTGEDLSTAPNLPAMVMFNACEAARVREFTRGKPKPEVTGRSELLRANAGMAESLLRGGLANYVSTYWPVSDAAAKAFAETMYTGLLNGAPLGEAITKARDSVHALGRIDWANYIHYGNWRFRIKAAPDRSR